MAPKKFRIQGLTPEDGWIAERLAMGHASTVSRLAKEESAHSPMLRKLERVIRADGAT